MSGAEQQLLQGRQNDQASETQWVKFTQQRLSAWQIDLPPTIAIGLYLLGGVSFFVIGLILYIVAGEVEELSFPYTDVPLDSVSDLEPLEVNSDMQPPIWIYYELDGFHQNHRRYVKSRDPKQLEGKLPLRVTVDELALCHPAVVGDAGRPLYPCGLVARSVFNDSFAFSIKGPEDAKFHRLKVNSDARIISWPQDVDGGKFFNVIPEEIHASGLQNQELLDMWLTQRYPPVSCVQTAGDAYKPVYVATEMRKVAANTDLGTPERTVTVTKCRGYKETAMCDFVDIKGKPVACEGDYQLVQRPDDWGLKSGHFLNWMRVAGLPKFRKLWGMVNVSLPKGTRLKVSVASHFPVSGFQGSKAVVLSTSSSIGGRNDFLGKGYLLVGMSCILFGAWFMWKHLYPGPP